MKKIIIGTLASSIILMSCKQGGSGSESFSGLKNQADSLSYFIGTSIGANLKQDSMESYFVEAAFLKGLEDFLKGGDSSLVLKPEDGMKLVQRIAQEKLEKQFAGVIKAGEDFLKEKSKQADVVTLPSGLRYKVLVEGKGPKPQLADTVVTHYHGTLVNGTIFDSSIERGEPAKFPVGRVIPGWSEALQLMPVGSKWELYIPYNLAYGEMGTQGPIGPYETLIFEVELLEIK